MEVAKLKEEGGKKVDIYDDRQKYCPITTMRYVEHNLIARFTGKKTVKQLLSKLKIDSLKYGFSRKEKSLASYISTYLKCPVCQNPLSLRKSRKNNRPILGCTNYPNCTFIEKLDIAIVENYLQENNIRCDKWGSPLKARVGRYGLFIGCGGYPFCKNTVEVWEV